MVVCFTGFSHLIESWIETFPDPSNLPARLSHTLRIRGTSILAKASLDARPWIRAFDNIMHLSLDPWDDFGTSRPLTPLDGLSPMLKSLSVGDSVASLPHSQRSLTSSVPFTPSKTSCWTFPPPTTHPAHPRPSPQPHKNLLKPFFSG